MAKDNGYSEGDFPLEFKIEDVRRRKNVQRQILNNDWETPKFDIQYDRDDFLVEEAKKTPPNQSK